MNKWFESKNFANYAKTALQQAQKRIDQVLDIKEEEILANTNNKKPTENPTDEFKLSSSSTSSLKSKENNLDEENDNFFSSFLNQTKKEQNVEYSVLGTSSFETSSTHSSQKISVFNDELEDSVSESVASSVRTLNNEDSKSSKNRQIKQKQNIDIEKQNWIQSFVDSSSDSQTSSVEQSKDSIILDPNIPPAQTEIQQEKKEEPSQKEEEKKNIDLDFVKIENNNGNLSGNASSNEEGLETCASSDIEVLSLPSNNGDQLLALTQAHLAKQGSIQRIPSLASMAKNISKTNSKSSSTVKQIFVKSPPAPLLTTQPINKVENSKQNEVTLNNPAENADKSILEAREAHILKLNKQNVKLQEENDNLLSEIEKLKYESSEKMQMMQRSLNDLNAKFLEANNEREQFKKGVNDIQRELSEVKNALKEKEEQVEQLTQEGVKLSKQELNQSNIIKKLRTKEKETEEILSILKNDYQKSQKELEELKKILDAKEEMESKNLETLKKLEKAALTLEKELATTKHSLEDSEEKCKGLENTLQNTFKELAELHKANAAKDSRINEATSSIENQLKEEIQLAVEKERMIMNKKQESLKWELESVRQDITRIEQQHSLREDMLRKEIADLQQQLRDSEMRNNELSQNISSATRPLLRQIENLQTSHSSQIELLENAERNLIERLKESQANLCEVTEKNRQNQEALIDITQQCKTYEVQIQTLKMEKSKLNADYQLCKTTLENYENEKLEKEAQSKALISSLNQQIETLTREKKFLERQLEIEKTKVENDSKKFQALLNEYSREKELLLQQQQLKSQLQQSSTSQASESSAQNSPIPSLTSSLSRFPSMFDANSKASSIFENPIHNSTNGAINVLEMLQSKLKQKEGEIAHLQKEIQNLERIRESMAKELVNLSNKLELLQEQSKEYPQLKDNYEKLTIQYNELLTMYGEKTEENEELKMDLQDVKEMYKLQIEDLIKRSS